METGGEREKKTEKRAMVDPFLLFFHIVQREKLVGAVWTSTMRPAPAAFAPDIHGAEREHWLSEARLSSLNKCGHQVDGWLLLAMLCPEISPESNSVQILQKLFQ